jgi:SAM-dependent methyltransferase
MPSADEIREVQRATWAGLSAGWEKWDSVIMDQLGPVGAAMIENLGIAEDQQHLDVAAGTGEPGLSIARLSPKGRVVLTDLVAEMLGIAARRASAQGVANIETKVCSADDLPFHDAAFDASQCVLATCSSPTWSRRRPSLRACSSRADVFARRYG